MLRELLQDLLPEFLFTHFFFGTNEGPGQDDGIFDEIGYVNTNAPRLVLPCMTAKPCGMPSTHRVVAARP